MTDAELPQPIYPPGGGAVPPAPGAAGAGHAGGPPPGGLPPTGYGSGSVGDGPGGEPPGGGLDPRVMIGIGVAAVVLVAGIVFLVVRSGSGGDDKAAASTTTERAVPSTTVRAGAVADPDRTTAPPPTSAADPAADLRERAEAVAWQQLDSSSAETDACMADGFAANPTLLDWIEPMADGVTFDDPGLADEFARIVVACATPEELSTEFGNAFAYQGIAEPELGCMMANLDGFEAPQWQDFLSTVLQPAEAAYAEQLFIDLATC